MTENTTKHNKIQVIDPFTLLTKTQWRYITARLENPSFNKKQAAKHIGLAEMTVYKWDGYVHDALYLAQQNIHKAALAMRKNAVLKAIAVKVKLLDSDEESIRSKAATEIIEWNLGKATQPVDSNTTGDLTIKVIYEDALSNADSDD